MILLCIFSQLRGFRQKTSVLYTVQCPYTTKLITGCLQPPWLSVCSLGRISTSGICCISSHFCCSSASLCWTCSSESSSRTFTSAKRVRRKRND